MRKFESIHYLGTYWIYGTGTRNPEGDYYYNHRYVEPAKLSLARILQDSSVREVLPDINLEVDEGL